MKTYFPVEGHRQTEQFATGARQHEFAHDHRRRNPRHRSGAEQVADDTDRQRQNPLAPVVDRKRRNTPHRTEQPHREQRNDGRVEHGHPQQVELDRRGEIGELGRSRHQQQDDVERHHQRMQHYRHRSGQARGQAAVATAQCGRGIGNSGFVHQICFRRRATGMPSISRYLATVRRAMQ